MYYADNTIQSSLPNVNNDSKAIKRLNSDGGNVANIASTTSLGSAALELSDSIKEALKAIDPLQDGDTVSASSLSDEAKEALKKIADQYSPLASTEDSEDVSVDVEPLVAQVDERTVESDAVQEDPEDSSDDNERNARPMGPNGEPLSEDEVRVVDELKRRDVAVRAHENAHVAAGGGLTSAPTYEYQTGPDGKRYAVGGHVTIDTSAAKTSEATIAKAERIRAAALAPADPSPADRAVAAQATQMANNARAASLQEKQMEAKRALEEQSGAQQQQPVQQPAQVAAPPANPAPLAGMGSNINNNAPQVQDAIQNGQAVPAFRVNFENGISVPSLRPEIPPEPQAQQTVTTTDSSNVNLMTGFGGGRASLNSPEPSMGADVMTRIANDVSQLNTLFTNTEYSSVASSYSAMDSTLNAPESMMQTPSEPVSTYGTGSGSLESPKNPVGALSLVN